MVDQELSKLKIDKSKVASRASRGKRVFYPVLAVLALVAAVFLYRMSFFSPPVQVQLANVSLVYPSQGYTVLTASGYVIPQRKSALASKVTGRLVWLGVEEGSRVKKGDVVARLESQDVEASKTQAIANLEMARFNLENAKAELTEATLHLNRSKELVDKNFIARSEYDTAVARHKKAVAAVKAAEAVIRANEAALEAAGIQLEYTLIRAPFDGVVLTKNADIGDIVTPFSASVESKSAVVTIADMESLQVQADVSESSLGQVKIGQPCEIQLDALPDRRLRGAVHRIVPTGDRSKAAVMVKIRFVDRDPRILPEMSAKVSFLSRPVSRLDQIPRTAVSQKALVARGEGKTVFLVKGDRVEETQVRTGTQIGDMVEVISGLKAGDQVVLEPPPKLKSGARIRVGE